MRERSFFDRIVMPVQEPPDGRRGKHMALLPGQPPGNLNQSDVPVLLNPVQHGCSMSFSAMAVAVTAHRIRFDTACPFVTLMPAHRRGGGDAEFIGSGAAR